MRALIWSGTKCGGCVFAIIGACSCAAMSACGGCAGESGHGEDGACGGDDGLGNVKSSCGGDSEGGGCGGGGCNGGDGKTKKPIRLRNSSYEETKRAALEAAVPGELPQCYRCPSVGKCNPRGGEVLCWDCLSAQVTRNFRNQMTRARASSPSEHLLVAFSGGTRSAALSHVLRKSVGDLRGR